jgi:hypothetical protein
VCEKKMMKMEGRKGEREREGKSFAPKPQKPKKCDVEEQKHKPQHIHGTIPTCNNVS